MTTPQVIGLTPDEVVEIIEEKEAEARALLNGDFWDELDESVGMALVPSIDAPVPCEPEKVIVKDLDSWVKASSPLPRKELLDLRVRQERWYLLFMAQEVSSGNRVVIDSIELSDLNRLGRSYFGHDFATLVAECNEMTAYNEEQAYAPADRSAVA